MNNIKLRIFLVSISAIMIIVLSMLCLPFLAIGYENLLVKWDAHNPHIDSGYLGWKSVTVSNIGNLMIPESWSLHESNGFCYICEENGELWAVGTSFGHKNSKFKTYKTFAEMAYEDSFTDATVGPFAPFLLMDGSTAVQMVARGSGGDKIYYCIKLFISTEEEYVFLLEKNLSTEAKQFDIAEALVYSYAFAVEQLK